MYVGIMYIVRAPGYCLGFKGFVSRAFKILGVMGPVRRTLPVLSAL